MSRSIPFQSLANTSAAIQRAHEDTLTLHKRLVLEAAMAIGVDLAAYHVAPSTIPDKPDIIVINARGKGLTGESVAWDVVGTIDITTCRVEYGARDYKNIRYQLIPKGHIANLDQ